MSRDRPASPRTHAAGRPRPGAAAARPGGARAARRPGAAAPRARAGRTAPPRGRTTRASRTGGPDWARLRRVGLVLVVLLLASSYVRPAVDALRTRSEAGTQAAYLAKLEREHRRLEADARRLGTQRGLVAEARRLGMVREGERSYVVRGLPAD